MCVFCVWGPLGVLLIRLRATERLKHFVSIQQLCTICARLFFYVCFEQLYVCMQLLANVFLFFLCVCTYGGCAYSKLHLCTSECVFYPLAFQMGGLRPPESDMTNSPILTTHGSHGTRVCVCASVRSDHKDGGLKVLHVLGYLHLALV